ncbi:MAG: hypothetical protein H6585_06105 [Flavobacteriales bacterium]|nr:hypothetical protein [Flavobacteriales bacterium]MCB9447901.1 hypothetical protein [Flavobacteriales bacterium]
MKKSTVILCALALAAACKSTKVTKDGAGASSSGLTQSDADRGAAKFDGLTLAQLERGKEIDDKYCTACHAKKNYKEIGFDKLNGVVPNMVGKANKKAGAEVISTEDGEALLRYIQTMGPLSK